jgi:hypothetical protein
MGLTLNEVKILAMQTSGATRAALEAIAGEWKGCGKPRNKFNVAAKEDRTADGIIFASKREMQCYLALKIAERAGLIRDLKLQPRYVVQPKMTLPDGTKQRAITYVLDFEFERDGRGLVVVDVKGMELPMWKMKAKMFRARYPDILLEIWK